MMSSKRRVLSLICFVIVISILLVPISYLSRQRTDFKNCVDNLKNEEANVDVLCIGGSSTYVYWSPMIAYKEYGISSYDFSDSAMAPALIKGLLEESKGYCNPYLYVIDIRGFETAEKHPEVFNRGYFQTYTDAFPYGRKRYDMIHYAYNYANIGVDELSLHIDLICNHKNLINNLFNKDVNNDVQKIVKGQYIQKREFEEVKLNNFDYVKSIGVLSNETENVLIDLLEYLKKNSVNTLFVLNAYSIEDENSRLIYNAIFNIIDSYGFDYIDTNLYYDDMGLNGSTDFYNANHVNAFGAEKYTKWLGKYLCEKYKLDDHRKDKDFVEWNKEIEQFNKIWLDLKNYYNEKINAY